MEDIDYWLFLNSTPGLGPRSIAAILEHFDSPKIFIQSRAWEDGTLALKDKTKTFLSKQDFNQIADDLRWHENPINHIITVHDAAYPTRLKEIADPPPVLYVHGNLDVLSKTQLAIVGSRNPSPSGKHNAHQFSLHLAAHGLVITSGLAIGVDGASHQGALDGKGQTVAVMGTSLNRVYPSRHHQLAHNIAENGGALVSEFSIDTPPKPYLFPKRNRIISGMSVGTLVIEAAVSSGSLITARLAMEQNREVFAIPGSIHNPLAKGCHALIRQGAKLVETAQDILEELGSITLTTQSAANPTPTESDRKREDCEHSALLLHFGDDPVSIDSLANSTNYAISELSSMLLMLELEGKVTALSGGMYCLSPSTTNF